MKGCIVRGAVKDVGQGYRIGMIDRVRLRGERVKCNGEMLGWLRVQREWENNRANAPMIYSKRHYNQTCPWESQTWKTRHCDAVTACIRKGCN